MPLLLSKLLTQLQQALARRGQGGAPLVLARLELLALTYFALLALLDAGPRRGGAIVVVIYVVALVFGSFRQGRAAWLRRLGWAAVVLTLPPHGSELTIAAGLSGALSLSTSAHVLLTMRGLGGLVVPEPPSLRSARVFRTTAVMLIGALVLVGAWSAAAWVESALAIVMGASMIGLVMLAWVVGMERRIEVGTSVRVWAAGIVYLPALLIPVFYSMRGWGSGLPLLTACFVVATLAARRVAAGVDVLHGARRARTVLGLVVFGTPLGAFLALVADDEPRYRSGLVWLAMAVGGGLVMGRRRLADFVGLVPSPWAPALELARGDAERRHPFEAIVKALGRLRQPAGLDATVGLVVLEARELLQVDAAGYVRRTPCTLPEGLLEVALQEPFAVLREEVLGALEVRRPDLRPMLAWLEGANCRALGVGIADGEPLSVLVLPHSKRSSALEVDELLAIKRLADTLAGHVAILQERRVGAERERGLQRTLERYEERAARREHEVAVAGARVRLLTERLAASFRGAHVAPESRLAYEHLKRAARHDQPTWLVLPAGSDAVGPLARAHLQGPRAEGPFVVVDATRSAEHDLARWTSPASSPLRLAHNGTLVVQDVRALPLPIQRVVARVMAERRLPSTEAEPWPLDVRLVLTSRESAQTLLDAGELAVELFERMTRGEPCVWPELSARAEDLRSLLTGELAREGLRVYGRPVALDDAGFRWLVEHPFWGGEAELSMLVIRLVRLAKSPVVSLPELHEALSLLPAQSVRDTDDLAPPSFSPGKIARAPQGVAKSRRPRRNPR